MRQLTYADHMAAALDAWGAIRRLHDKGVSFVDKLPEPDAAEALAEVLKLIHMHAGGALDALTDAMQRQGAI